MGVIKKHIEKLSLSALFEPITFYELINQKNIIEISIEQYPL